MLQQWLIDNCNTKAPIIIYGNKDPKIVEVMVAALKSGHAYVPIDVTFPADRVKKIAEITNAEYIFDFSHIEGVFDNMGFSSEIIEETHYLEIAKYDLNKSCFLGKL